MIDIDKKQSTPILSDLADLVYFYEHQSDCGLVDGAHDPHSSVERVKRVLDQGLPNWRDDGYVTSV